MVYWLRDKEGTSAFQRLPGVCDPGLSTLLTLGTGSATTQKFWIASCLVGFAGLLANRIHSSNDALRYLDRDTFFRLIPEHARLLTDVLIWLLLCLFGNTS